MDTHPHENLTRELPRSFVVLWLVLLVIVAGCIRVLGVSDYHYHPEEAMTVHIAEGETPAEVYDYSLYAPNPPLGHLMRHYWMKISAEPWFVRGQSLLFSLALVVLYYAIGLKLRGPFAGLCAAALIAFSHGSIEQAFAARNYSSFLAFISCTFYCYLQWRQSRSTLALVAYAVLGALASLIHFYAILPVFCMAACESIELFIAGESWCRQMRWAAANLFVAAVALGIYAQWMPLMAAAHGNNPYGTPYPPYLVTLAYSLLFPFAVSCYCLPESVALVLAALALLAVSQQSKKLLLSAFGLGMVLYAARIYFPVLGTRHDIWLFPFLGTGVALAMADAADWLGKKFPPERRVCVKEFLAVLIFLGCWFTYDPKVRFESTHEYVTRERDWPQLEAYLKGLGGNVAVIAQREDAGLFVNVYTYLNRKDAYSEDIRVTQAPYGGTRLLFDPYYQHTANKTYLDDVVIHAEAQGLLAHTDKLALFALRWSLSPMADWQNCADLDKEIVTFPPTPAGRRVTKADLAKTSGVLLIVSKETFFKEALAPGGKAHHCFRP